MNAKNSIMDSTPASLVQTMPRAETLLRLLTVSSLPSKLTSIQVICQQYPSRLVGGHRLEFSDVIKYLPRPLGAGSEFGVFFWVVGLGIEFAYTWVHRYPLFGERRRRRLLLLTQWAYYDQCALSWHRHPDRPSCGSVRECLNGNLVSSP